jgi:hypothetical protein
MKVVIQDRVFGEEQDRLVSVLKDLYVDYVIGEPESITAGEPIFCRGTIDFVRNFGKRFDHAFEEVGRLTLRNYDYTRYSKYYIDVLFNSSYAVYPWWYLKTLKPLSPLFIRPLSGRKIFTGTTTGVKYFQKDLKIIESLPSTKGLTNSTLVVVSADKSEYILGEFRLIMKGNKCLGWDRYSDTFIKSPKDDLQEICKWFTWYPDTYYTADIVYTPYGWKLVELNSLASAGWYDIDPTPVILSLFEEYEK